MDSSFKKIQDMGLSLTTHQERGDSFYCCICVANNNQHPVNLKHAKDMQNKIFECEMKNSMYFHLFRPQCITCDGNHLATDCLKQDFKKMNKEKTPPSPREVFAAADFLQRYICVFKFEESDDINSKNFLGYIFSPMNKIGINVDPVYILMSGDENSLEFSNVCFKKSNVFPGDLTNKDHMNCVGRRFANDFTSLFHANVSFTGNSSNMYSHLSSIFYGTKTLDRRILNIICNFELEEDKLDLFYSYANSSIPEQTNTKVKDKRSMLETHVESVRVQKCFGDGEFYALSSVYNVDVILDTTGRGEWKKFMSVICTNVCCFDSPVILQKEPTTSPITYRAFDANSDGCSCCWNQPEIQGHIEKMKGKIHKMVCTYLHHSLTFFIKKTYLIEHFPL